MAMPPDELLPVEIRELWAANLEDEFAKIRDIIDGYPYVVVDVHHPGVHGARPCLVHRPLRPKLLINDVLPITTEGVDPQRFAELLMSSSVVLNMDLHW
jgi:hypothetical protein